MAPCTAAWRTLALDESHASCFTTNLTRELMTGLGMSNHRSDRIEQMPVTALVRTLALESVRRSCSAWFCLAMEASLS